MQCCWRFLGVFIDFTTEMYLCSPVHSNNFRYIEIFNSSLNEATACIGYGPKPRPLMGPGMGARPGPYNRNPNMGSNMGMGPGYGRGRGGRNLKGGLLHTHNYVEFVYR